VRMAGQPQHYHLQIPENHDHHHHHVIIVGAGMSGIAAARTLLEGGRDSDQSVHVTMLEASDYVGGRVRADRSWIGGDDKEEHQRSYKLDMGAEIVHGKNTLLTSWCEDFVTRGLWDLEGKPLFDELFITAHGDGGPDEKPTPDGKYGMYYVGGELINFDDERLHPLNNALEEMETVPTVDDDDDNRNGVDGFLTVGDHLQGLDPPLSSELMSLAVASYGNTVGTSNLSDISLSVLNHFERHWEANEVHGDCRLPAHIGMTGVVDAALRILKEDFPTASFTLKLNWKVDQIGKTNAGINGDSSATGKHQYLSQPVVVRKSVPTTPGNEQQQYIEGDAVIVTVPPHKLKDLNMNLSARKQKAVQYIGFENFIKVCVKFSGRLWPEKLHSIVSENTLIPEMWFKSFEIQPSTYEYVAICFLASGKAQEFLERISSTVGGENDKDGTNKERLAAVAGDLVIHQLSKMLQIQESDWKAVYMDSRIYEWGTHPNIGGGYMYPRRGCTMEHIRALAVPEEGGRVFFAGEATNTDAAGTVQAAMETGLRAAKEVQAMFAASQELEVSVNNKKSDISSQEGNENVDADDDDDNEDDAETCRV